MSRSLVLVLIAVAFAAGVGAGVVGILWATGNVAPSTDTSQAVATLDINAEPTANPVMLLSTENAQLRATIDALSAALAEPQATAEPEAASDTADTATSSTETPPDSAASTSPARALYRITEDESEARFYISETLSGNDIIVVGTTNRIAGDVIVNFNDPTASQLGQVAVNARTLRTDDDFRNSAIRGLILNTSAHEFITFAPTGFEALSSAPVSVGDTVEFRVTGDLTISGATRSVTFDVTVAVEAEDRISGLARTEVNYRDFNIEIRAPPTVTNIEEIVTIELDFVALAVAQ